MNTNYKISIVTVCLNAGDEIEKTFNSILDLETCGFEYIVKDGGSKDNTENIVLCYQKKFEEKGIDFVFVSKADSGIYNAMNQALEYCNGEWINYMNAGDTFFRGDVLEDIFHNKKYDKEQVLYGNTLLELCNGYKIVQLNNMKKLISGIGISQQVCFFRKSLLEKYKFDETYKLLADYDLLVKVVSNKMDYKSMNIIVAVYNRRGVSSNEIYQCNLEREAILLKYGYLNKTSPRYVRWIWHIKTLLAKKMPIIRDLVLCWRGGGIGE